MVFSVPPGYRRKHPPVRPKLDPFIGIIDGLLEEDKRRPAKQRHTSKRIFERLRDEHGYAGGLTIVKDEIVVNSAMETGQPGIYAAGDVTDHEGKLDLIATGFGEAAVAVNFAKARIDPTARAFPGHSTEEKWREE